MIRVCIVAIFALFSTSSFAGEGTFLKYSVSATDKISSQKGLSFGYQSEFLFLDTKWETGFWSDQSDRPGAKSSAFGYYSVGVEPTYQGLYVNFFQGVGAITHPDSVLGGPFQFFEDFGFGIKDRKRKTALGFQYRHVSSAGIFRPNKGRDMFGIQVRIPW